MSQTNLKHTTAVTIFNQSIVCNKLRYKTYIGDKDTHHEVVKSDPYPSLSIKKGECGWSCSKAIGHTSTKPAYKIKGYEIIRW